MSILFKLTLAQLRRSKVRLGVSLLAMVATISMVVHLIASFDAMIADFDDEAQVYMGEYEWTVGFQVPRASAEFGGRSDGTDAPQKRGQRGGRPGGGGAGFLPEWTPERLRNNPSVDEIATAIQTRVSIVNAKRWYPGFVPMREQIGPQRDPYLVGIDVGIPRFPIELGRWFENNDEMEGVLGSAAAERLNIQVGDSVYVNSSAGDFFVNVVGIVKQTRATPGVNMGGGGGGPASSSMFVSMATAARINGYSGKLNLIYVKLKPNVDKADFKAQFADAPLGFYDAKDLERRFATDRSVNSMKSQAHSATGVALLCAIFIIFTTLSMGVTERIRQLAILRAVGLSRRQTAGLIFLEGLLLAIPAWLLGLGGGALLLLVQRGGQDVAGLNLFEISPTAFWISGAAAVLGALLAAVFPAIQASRINPLDAMKPSAVNPTAHAKLTRILFAIGIVLIAINPILVLMPGIDYDMRQMLTSTLGYGTLAIGFLCLTPAFIRWSEIIFVPLLGHLLAFNPVFLKRHFSGNLWRTAGTAIALTIGLSLYTSIQFWGYTMVVPFLPTSESVPDAIAVFTPSGIPESEIESVRLTPGVDSTAFLILAGEQAKFSDTQRALPAFRREQVRQDNLLLLGMDLSRAFEDGKPMFNLNFVKGNLKDALAMMRTERACIIPNELHQPTGLDVGDTIELIPPHAPNTVLTYKVAGVVEIPGWHWLSKHSGLRRRGGFTAGMAFADISRIRADFKIGNPDFFWFNVLPGTDEKKLEADLQTIAERHPGQPVNVQGIGEIAANRPYVKITSTEGVHKTVSRLADNSISKTSQIPLIALLIAVLAVVNTMLASVRARKWSLGVMRAVGLSRSALMRMMFGEALMIGLIACVLSFAFGLVAAKCAVDICRWGYAFGGVTAELVIPWGPLAFGFGLTLLLCIVAALIPAWIAGRSEPLDLLTQSERD